MLADGSQASFPVINATMDVAVAKEVLTNLCEGCRHLGIKADQVARWEAMVAKLPAYAVNDEGAMKEWIHPELHDYYLHRHMPHLYPLFPGFEITREFDCYELKRCDVGSRTSNNSAVESGTPKNPAVEIRSIE